jgi:hypothetical protein
MGAIHVAALERAKLQEKETRRLAQIAKKRELTAIQMIGSEDGHNIAAIKLQARARTFLAVRRFALMRRNPFERVKGLKVLLNRGQEAFEELNASAKKSKESCDAAEQRLGGGRTRCIQLTLSLKSTCFQPLNLFFLSPGFKVCFQMRLVLLRLAHIRLANEDAMGSLRLALGKLDDVVGRVHVDSP